VGSCWKGETSEGKDGCSWLEENVGENKREGTDAGGRWFVAGVLSARGFLAGVLFFGVLLFEGLLAGGLLSGGPTWPACWVGGWIKGGVGDWIGGSVEVAVFALVLC
jgi:hypothetical protein